MKAPRRLTIDLHIHSNCSDGAFSPAELVLLAADEGLSAIAIADHDSVAGIAEGVACGKTSGVQVLPAVELSVQYKSWQDVHLLGYGMRWNDPVFQAKLNGFRERREHRNEEILERVNIMLAVENRPPVKTADVLAFARDAIGRPHIARALLERGYVSNIEDAFRRYLVPCNVPKQYWPIEDALNEIRRLGGVTVLAHPTTISTDRQLLREILTDLSESGLDGVEVYNNLAQPDESEHLRRLALELGLLVTGGSDFHGIEDGLQIGKGRGGIRFSESLLAPIRRRVAGRGGQLLSL